MSLKAYTDDELAVELKRREGIKNGVWPKETTIEANLETLDDHSLDMFLEEECGFTGDGDEYNNVMDDITNQKVSLKIERDGTTSVRLCPKEEDTSSNEVDQLET